MSARKLLIYTIDTQQFIVDYSILKRDEWFTLADFFDILQLDRRHARHGWRLVYFTKEPRHFRIGRIHFDIVHGALIASYILRNHLLCL